MPQKEIKKSIVSIPYSINQNNADVEIKKWHGNNEIRFDIGISITIAL